MKKERAETLEGKKEIKKKLFLHHWHHFRFPHWHYCANFAFFHQWTHFIVPHGLCLFSLSSSLTSYWVSGSLIDIIVLILPFFINELISGFPMDCAYFPFLHHWHHIGFPHGQYYTYFAFIFFEEGGKSGCVWQIECAVQTTVFKECSVKPQYSRIFCETTVLNLYITLTIISVNLIDWLMKIDEGRWRVQFKLNIYQSFTNLFIVSYNPLGLTST